MTEATKRPKAQSSLAEREMDKAEDQFKAFDENLQALTLDRMNMAPKEDKEQQTLLGQKDIEKSKDIYLKPFKSVASREPFNEKWRSQYNFATEYVHFTAENSEVIGEAIDLWTKPFPGMPAQEWKVPVNTPVWGPRHLAEQIKGCRYHQLHMDESKSVGSGGEGKYYGQMVVDKVKQRLDAHPVIKSKSIFMGANGF